MATTEQQPIFGITLPARETPRVSVVIPTLNEERDLPNLLDALANQTFRDFEIIIADANSPDRTREIADAAGCRIVEGGLPGPGRNVGADAARGELVLFLDADVAPEPDFLKKTITEFDERGLDIATCPAVPLKTRMSDAMMLSSYNAYMLLTQNIWPHAPGFCILIKRDLHMAMGGFDETVAVAEDHEYASRAARRGTFGVMITAHIPVSTRRFDSDGRFMTSIKYVMMALHRALVGEIKEDNRFFTYRFGHHYDETDRQRIMDILQQSPTDLAKRYAEVLRRQINLFD